MTINNDRFLDWESWRANRIASVTSAKGNLALVQTQWLPEGKNADLLGVLAFHPSTVTATEISRKNFDGEVVARGYRLWDSNSHAIQDFEGIETFEFDPYWIVEGLITRYAQSKPVAFEHIRDNGGSRDLAVPAEIAVVIEGESYLLQPFDDDGQLLLVFGDSTNGSETYGGGRFLKISHEPGEEKVILDFNRAFVPPCGFSEHYNCPLPPAQNRIKTPVRAGEKRPLFKTSVLNH
ncbi:MAG: DUF1684 domain-containing protein [Actinomycetota bacterium]